ncbi:hypothetical protein SAMN02745146_1048 [Hymenobacter daecheongensis DSM 21074]|uniref:Cell surface protein SprA n=1 Tax=Hymenobacter daecheongensis DSM 21074 TaxID=1121955 RepID=A0A1M6C6K5_9BACT|nr:hypothetical protein [Hymenobacter daecheongensis]SHI56612.1 hypothetical protein SAMN02745146_1048 [Hymenobacter daecheongensis DSM 21074]
MIRSITHRLLPACLLLMVLLAAHAAVGQQVGVPSSRRCRWVRLAPDRDTTSFALPDTLTVVPASVSIEGRSVAYDAPTDRYRYVSRGRRLPNPDPGRPDIIVPGAPDSVLVCYRVLPVQLSAARYRRPRSLMDSLSFTRRVMQFDDFAVKEQILSTPGISKTGNLSRGVSFGNTQNVFVNSSLNLQLEGKLTDKINLTAAISDQNVPFQPEGNTQQLQEFDRIYITLAHPNWNLTAGDVVLRNKPDYFLRFYKNVQGAAAEVNLGRPGRRSSSVAAAGVAKGKFASIDLAPIENVQGPYRLRGPNGEQFIIVLANSERVFLDGRLMTRGFDFDYVIDYNQAEITFSPKHLITRNSRLKVDFEYSDFNYSRTLTHLSHYQEAGRLSVRANYYREADNPDNSPNLTLDSLDRARLQALPGNVSQLSVPGGVAVQYNRQQVQYNRVTRTDPVTGQPVDTFVYPPTDSTRVFDVRFTQVDSGTGDYSLSPDDANANGRVYRYVGTGRGSYRAERLIPTPLEKQLVAVGTSFRLDSTATVFVDLASSQLDLNRFSAAADKGQAFRVGYAVLDRPLALPILRAYKLRTTLDYEYTSRRFAPIDRYRDVEFDRNWSTTSTTQGNAVRRVAREDNILNFSVGAVKDFDNAFNYRLSRRYRAGEVSGVQHWLDVARKLGDVEVRSGLFVLNSEAGRRHSGWARGEATARYVRGPVVPGYAYRFDKNRVALPDGDSLTSANYYDEHALFLQSRDSAKTRFRLDYTFRRDQTPQDNELRERGRAQTWQGTLASRLGQNQDLNVLLAYRDLAARDSARQRTVLSKIDWNASFFQNVLRSELSYSIATGRELKRDFAFLVVSNGQGTHYYGGDANGNTRQDKEEFFEAQTPDAQFRTHIKVFLPTDDYITAFTNRFSYRLTTSAPRAWREGQGLRALAARFSTLTTVTLDRRTTETALSSRLNPFAFQTDDQLLLSLNKLLRNTLYFNRSNPIFGAEFTVQQTQQKVLLTNGTDTRNLASQQLLVRRTLAQSFTGRLTTARTVRASLTNYLSTLPGTQPARDFRLLSYEASPEISYQPNNSLRFTGTYLHTTRRNTREGAEKDTRGTFDELGLETRLSQVSKRTLTGAVRYVGVGFKGGPENSLVGLEILNALRPGSNFTWNLNLEQRLSNGLNVTVAYDGRKANGLNAVHTGRMQVSVLF